MRKPIIILIILLLAVSSGIKTLSAEPERDMPATISNLFQITTVDATGKREILGTATSDILQEYAVIRNTDSGKKFLYGNDDYIDSECKIIKIYDNFLLLETFNSNSLISNYVILIPGIPYRGIEFVETVELDTFEYSYRMIKQNQDIKDRGFELVNIQGHKATLERDYKERLGNLSQEQLIPGTDEIFFKQLKTKKISEYIWEVDSQSVTTPVVDNIQKAIAYVARRVKATGFGKNGLKINFNSKVCSGGLDREGFLVNELSPEVREKAGLIDGDIIKTINGKRIYNIIDLIFLFLEIRNGLVSELNVNISRGHEIKTLTYIIN